MITNSASRQRTGVPLKNDAASKTNRIKTKGKPKILLVGSVGSGKTTALAALTNGDFLSTDETPSDHYQFQKKSTTVALDYGNVFLDDNTHVRVYGTPGQRRFNFMSSILISNAVGIIILINNNTSNPINELDYYLKTHYDFLQNNHAVIGITHNDTSPKPSLKQYQAYLDDRGHSWPTFKIDARNRNHMMMLVTKLMALKG
ncbi:ATP/GTP-binding protein [Pseudomonadota bacterium]